MGYCWWDAVWRIKIFPASRAWKTFWGWCIGNFGAPNAWLNSALIWEGRNLIFPKLIQGERRRICPTLLSNKTNSIGRCSQKFPTSHAVCLSTCTTYLLLYLVAYFGSLLPLWNSPPSSFGWERDCWLAAGNNLHCCLIFFIFNKFNNNDNDEKKLSSANHKLSKSIYCILFISCPSVMTLIHHILLKRVWQHKAQIRIFNIFSFFYLMFLSTQTMCHCDC